MTDNRQFTDGTTIGGVDVYYEDKKLAESTSTTTMTTEGVLLKGTDGAFYEIDKTSLSEVIRAELGNILADNSKNNGTSVGKVPTLNSTGNALGASSVADLATVLGVIKSFVGSNEKTYSLGKCGKFSCKRIIGSDFVDSRGILDVTIYGNGDSGITARGTDGATGYKMKCYKDSSDNIYVKFPTGMSASFIVIGALPVESTLPSGASELTITSYAN